MKITEVKTFLVNANDGGFTDRPRGRNWIFCKIVTDEGIHGVGEGGGWPTICQHGIKEVTPFLIGENPFDIGRLNFKVYDIIHGHGLTGAVRGGIVAAIDTALWDIKGKALGVPVYELLGGKVRDKIRLYAHASTVERASELAGRGYTAFKCAPSAKVLKKLREAMGDEMEIGVHCHGQFSPAAALQLAKAIEPYNPAFFEEPTNPDDLDALEWLAERTTVPLGSGERLFSRWAFRDLITSRAIALAQPELTRLGILEEKKIAILAEMYGVKIAPHDGSVGPIAEMANIHVLASSTNAIYLEHKADDVSWRSEVTVGMIPEDDGYVPVPGLPGLGIDIDEDACAEHPVLAVEDVAYRFRDPDQAQKYKAD